MLDARFWTPDSYRVSKYSPSQPLNDLVRVCQIVEQKIWSAHLQSLARPTASSNRNGARAKCFSAGDVVLGIADDIDIGRIEIVTMSCLSAFSGKSAKLVSILWAFRKRAKSKKFQKTELLKLSLSAWLRISGKKAKKIFRPRFKWSRY